MATLAQQLVARTKTALYEGGLALASDLGVNVASLTPIDPTRSLYHFVAAMLEPVEAVVARFAASGFLDHASGVWLTFLAQQVFRVERITSTRATTIETLTNTGGGFYTVEAGDLTFRKADGKTYRNTSGGTLAPWPGGIAPYPTLDLDIVADETGSASSAAAGAINALVTSLLGVTCTNTNAALGLDEESDPSLRDRCRGKLGMLSPCGPADAYNFVVRSSDLTGVTSITRARTIGESATGDVLTYVAGATGAVSGDDVAAAQDAVDRWAAPRCITATVANTSNVPVAVTYEVWLYDSVSEEDATIKAKIDADLAVMFARRPIGGDIIAPATSGKLYKSLIEATIKASYPVHVFRVAVTSPAGDTSLTIDQVATLDGTPTGAINQETAP